MPAIIRVVDGRTVIKVGENTALASKYATLAEQFANAAGVSADAVEIAAAAVGVYTTVGAGESATTNGQSFYVASGGDVTLYLNNAGTGDEVASIVTTAKLASTAPGEGAALVGLEQGGTIGDAVKWVTPEMFGAVGDGVADDTIPTQNAIDYLESIAGGKLLVSASYLVGGLTIDAMHIVVEGQSRCAKFIVKNGTTGFTVSKDWVHFRHLEVGSQGTEGDGLGTNGILYTKGSGSIGHVYNYDLNIENFSGVGVEFRNALDLTMISCFHRHCKTGLKFDRNGTGGADFSTTTQLINCYVIGCDDYGIDATYVYRSTWNVIAEYCGIGIRNNIGDLTLERCYFENNVTAGAQLTDTGGQDIDNYSHPSAGVNTVTRTRGVIGNAGWYTSGQSQGDRWSKRYGFQTAWGRDTEYLAGVGTTDNIALKYGEAIVPMVYGDDLLDQEAWASQGTSEFGGWDVIHGGYKISGTATGGAPRGMQQSVSLDSTKTYVIALDHSNVSGNPISTVQVDAVTRTPGVPFTVTTTGSKVVRCYSGQSSSYENYIHVFRLMEVLEDQTQIAKTTDRLLRAPGQRAERYASAAPSSGYHAVGERVWNSAPSVDVNNMVLIGWITTTAGNPGTQTPMYVSAVSPAT